MTSRPDPSAIGADPALAADYRQAGFNRRLGFGAAPALLVVDMCRAYFEAGSPLDIGRPEVLDAIRALVAAARATGLPVVWTRVEFEPGGADGGMLYRKVGALALFDRGQALGGWVADLVPAPGEAVVTKQGASAFFGTDLARRLQTGGVDTVIVCGVSTSGCVRASALDACRTTWCRSWCGRPAATATPPSTRPACSTSTPSTPTSSRCRPCWPTWPTWPISPAAPDPLPLPVGAAACYRWCPPPTRPDPPLEAITWT